MKVLYVHAGNELYGADVVLLELLKGLDKNMFEPLVILPGDVKYEGLLSRELAAINIRFKLLRMGVIRRRYFNIFGSLYYSMLLIRSIVKLLSIVRKEKIDIVHSNTAAVLAGAIVAKAMRIPHVWHVHEIITPEIVRNVLARIIYHFSNIVIAVSSAVKQNLCKALSQNSHKIKIVHNGVDIRRFSPTIDGSKIRETFNIPRDDIVVGAVGRIRMRKGQRLLLEAARKVVDVCPNVKFLIVGGVFEGEEDQIAELHQTVKALGLEKKIVLTGFRADIPEILASFNVFVLPSILPESFPTAVLEAMAAAKPVVATMVGGVSEMVVPGVTGLLVSPDDSSKMAEAIIRLVKDKKLRISMGKAGRERVERRFSAERFVSDFQDVYKKILAGV